MKPGFQCNVPGCDKLEPGGRGLCRLHYQRAANSKSAEGALARQYRLPPGPTGGHRRGAKLTEPEPAATPEDKPAPAPEALEPPHVLNNLRVCESVLRACSELGMTCRRIESQDLRIILNPLTGVEIELRDAGTVHRVRREVSPALDVSAGA